MALTKTERIALARIARNQLARYIDSFMPGMVTHIETVLNQNVGAYRAERLLTANGAIETLRSEEGS